MWEEHPSIERALTRMAFAWLAVLSVSASLAYGLSSALSGLAMTPDDQWTGAAPAAISYVATPDPMPACAMRVGTYNAWLIAARTSDIC